VETIHTPFPSAAACSLNLAVATTQLSLSMEHHVGYPDCHS
jgi:hypothetical protein